MHWIPFFPIYGFFNGPLHTIELELDLHAIQLGRYDYIDFLGDFGSWFIDGRFVAPDQGIVRDKTLAVLPACKDAESPSHFVPYCSISQLFTPSPQNQILY